MKAITAPTLIMTGDEDWPCLEPGVLMKKHISTAGLVVMPNAGHNINLEDPAAFNEKVRLLWIGAGTGEEAFHRSAKAMHDALGRAGVRSVFVEQKGTAHEWQTWRKALHDFAPRLFGG